MRILKGVVQIGSLAANLVRRWQGTVAAGDCPGDNADGALLRGRMSRLGIDADTFVRAEPDLFANLATLCRECTDPQLCRRDLHHDPADTTWEDYCPNAVVLQAITELRWFSTGASRTAR